MPSSKLYIDLKTPAEKLLLLTEEEFRESAENYRKRVLTNIGRSNEALKEAKEHKRKLVRKRNLAIRRDQGDVKSRSIVDWERKESYILDVMHPNRNLKWKSKKRTSVARFDLRDFSFFENPSSVMERLYNISRCERHAKEIYINFLDDYCEDVAPLVILSALKRDMPRIFKGGIIKPRLNKVFRSIGLDKYMNIKLEMDHGTSDIWPFKLRERSGEQLVQTDQLVTQQKDEAAADFIAELQNWLKEVSLDEEGNFTQLSDVAEDNTVKIITELLDNAERHSSQDPTLLGKWLFSGFMAKRGRASNSPYYQCNISIVSIGRTISQTINSSEDDETRSRLSEYVNNHTNNFYDEVLSTVLAAQAGMTKKRYMSTVGGMGIPRAIEFLNRLGGAVSNEYLPEVVIVSGAAAVSFRYPYHFVDPNTMEQWLNEKNRYDDPPSKGHVSYLSHPFPGTVITMRFRMNPENFDDEDS